MMSYKTKCRQGKELQQHCQQIQGHRSLCLVTDSVRVGYLVRERFCYQSANGRVKAGLELERGADPVVTRTAAEDAEVDT